MKKEDHFNSNANNFFWVLNKEDLKEFHSRTWEAAITSIQSKKPWPQEDDIYWFEDTDGTIMRRKSHDDQIDGYRQLIGNMFKTETDGIEARERKIRKCLKRKMGK